MVEPGKALGMASRFQAVQWGSMNTISALAGIGCGWLVQRVTPHHPFLLIAGFPALSFNTTGLPGLGPWGPSR